MSQEVTGSHGTAAITPETREALLQGGYTELSQLVQKRRSELIAETAGNENSIQHGHIADLSFSLSKEGLSLAPDTVAECDWQIHIHTNQVQIHKRLLDEAQERLDAALDMREAALAFDKRDGIG